MNFNDLPDNAMLKHAPNFYNEWNFERNEGLDVFKMTFRSNRNVWWKCEQGHEWQSLISNRTRQKSGCPFCNEGKKGRVALQVGINDMWTTNPEQAKLLLNPEDGYRYTRASSKIVDWKCTDCGNIIEKKSIWHTHIAGFYCPRCSDNTPFGEKFIYSLLKNEGIYFKYDCAQKWSKRYRYDFFLPDYNCIIEVHGIQHYEDGTFSSFSKRTRSLEEELKNDATKKSLAIRNGITEYIVIDARESTVSHIKKSIENSKLKKIVETIDYEKIGRISSKSFVKEACSLWEDRKTVREIADIMQIKGRTIIKYLNRGNEIGWCNYSREEDVLRKGLTPTQNKKHKVVQLDKDNNYIATFDSMTEAGKQTGVNISNISSCCRGVLNSAGGYRWIFEAEYNLH